MSESIQIRAKIREFEEALRLDSPNDPLLQKLNHKAIKNEISLLSVALEDAEKVCVADKTSIEEADRKAVADLNTLLEQLKDLSVEFDTLARSNIKVRSRAFEVAKTLRKEIR